jgi:hypothetical protein
MPIYKNARVRVSALHWSITATLLAQAPTFICTTSQYGLLNEQLRVSSFNKPSSLQYSVPIDFRLYSILLMIKQNDPKKHMSAPQNAGDSKKLLPAIALVCCRCVGDDDG